MITKEQIKEANNCPNCGIPLYHFSGLGNIPDYFYCSVCMGWAYNEDGEKLGRLE